MKPILFLALVLAAAVAALEPATLEEREFRGHITDTMCGAEHMMEGMSAKECADECVRMGSSYALFSPAEDKLYELDGQDEAKRFSGEKVIVRGHLSEDGNEILVTSIEKQAETEGGVENDS